MTTELLYGAAGIALLLLGLWSFLVHRPLLRKLIAINVMGAGVFHVLVAVAYRGIDIPPDPVPHALVLTGIVVAVSATALALSFGQRLGPESRPSVNPDVNADVNPGVKLDSRPHPGPNGKPIQNG